nr:hypothetical protein Itr_chr06CG15230 [Ipomoea trifida]
MASGSSSGNPAVSSNDARQLPVAVQRATPAATADVTSHTALTRSSVGGNPVLFRLHDPVRDAAGDRRRRKRVAAGRLG